MKSFYERFIDEAKRRYDAGEIDETTFTRWVAMIKTKLQQLPKDNPLSILPTEQ